MMQHTSKMYKDLDDLTNPDGGGEPADAVLPTLAESTPAQFSELITVAVFKAGIALMLFNFAAAAIYIAVTST